MDVVVKARHCNVTEEFRAYVAEKITRLEKLDDRVIRVEVELSAERNKRQHDQASRVEITVRTKGPVVRAEAAAEDKPAAFDLALDKLMAQFRKAADRKRVHHGQHTPRSLYQAAAVLPNFENGHAETNGNGRHTVAGIEVDGDGPAGGAGEGAPRRADEPRPGAARDGAGRPRLLPVPGRRAPGPERGLPAQGLRLRRDPAGHPEGRGQPASPAGAGGRRTAPGSRPLSMSVPPASVLRR